MFSMVDVFFIFRPKIRGSVECGDTYAYTCRLH